VAVVVVLAVAVVVVLAVAVVVVLAVAVVVVLAVAVVVVLAVAVVVTVVSVSTPVIEAFSGAPAESLQIHRLKLSIFRNACDNASFSCWISPETLNSCDNASFLNRFMVNRRKS
ncbi:hypothetical protein, partial [Paenibacillus alba]